MTLLATLEDFFSSRGQDPPLEAEHESVMRAVLALEIASDVIRRKTGRTFDRTATTVTLDGPGTDSMLLPNPPIAEVTSVITLDPAADETEVDATDYRLDPTAGILRRIGGTWPKGWLNIEVELLSGYLLPGTEQQDSEELPALPSDVSGLALRLAARLSDEGLSSASLGSSGELKSVSMGIYAETYSTAADVASAVTSHGLDAFDWSVIQDYRLVRVG